METLKAISFWCVWAYGVYAFIRDVGRTFGGIEDPGHAPGPDASSPHTATSAATRRHPPLDVPEECRVRCPVGGRELVLGINPAGVNRIEQLAGRPYSAINREPFLRDLGVILYVADLTQSFEDPDAAFVWLVELTDEQASHVMDSIGAAANLQQGGGDFDGLFGEEVDA